MITDPQTPKNKRASSWVASLVIHSVAITALLLYRPAPDTRILPPDNEIVTPLIYVPPAKPFHLPEKIRIPRSLVKIQPPTQHALVVKTMPAVIPQKQEKPTIAAPELVESRLPALAVAKLQTPDLPSRPPAPAIPVKTGVFANPGQSPNGQTPSPRLEVQTGGFGSAAEGRAESPANGNGSGIHTGAFGDRTRQGAGMPSGNGKSVLVANAGFGTASAGSAAPAQRQMEKTSSDTPVEVLWKPKPVYTEEAREKKLEGDVTLEVMFRASGDVQVLRVVRGLGAGLDESARAAAQQIRFRPGKKDGVPVDRTGLVLIKFELS